MVFQQEIQKAKDIIEKSALSAPSDIEKIRKQIEVKELQINKLAAETAAVEDLGAETKKRISVAERGTASQPIKAPKKPKKKD